MPNSTTRFVLSKTMSSQDFLTQLSALESETAIIAESADASTIVKDLLLQQAQTLIAAQNLGDPLSVTALATRLVDHIASDVGLIKKAQITVGLASSAFKIIQEKLLISSFSLFDSKKIYTGSDAQKFIQFLLTDLPLSRNLLSISMLQALFFKANPLFFETALKELQDVLDHLFIKMTSSTLLPPQQRMAEILLGYILSIVSFFNIPTGTLLYIPQKKEGAWTKAAYKTEQFHLFFDPSWSPLHAYVLTPQEESFTPLVLFMGTPFPTASGALAAIYSDCSLGNSVGEVLLQKEVRKRLALAMQKAIDVTKKPCHLYGISLGGSLALMMTALYPDLIGQTDVFNSPALRPEFFQKVAKDPLKPQPVVNIFWQEGDLLPYIGVWDTSWRVYRIFTVNTQNPYWSHIRTFAAHRLVAVLETDPAVENQRRMRRYLTLAHKLISVPVHVSYLIWTTARSRFFSHKIPPHLQPST